MSAAATLKQDGRVWFRAALSDDDLSAFEAAATPSTRPGARIDSAAPLAAALEGGPLQRVLSPISPTLRAVRIVSFSKTPDNNWAVPWHQDRVIAVNDRIEAAGYGNWSRKSGVWHCEPPVDLLSRMVFVRVHLDDTDADNGAMEIALGSHRSGAVASSDAEAVAATCPHETCTAQRGDVLALNMLTLHRSRPSRTSAPRRVFRIDYADEDLPPPLQWAR